MFGWGLPNYQNSNPQQDDALPCRERGLQAKPKRSPVACVFRPSKCNMAELRQRKSAPDKSKVPSTRSSVEADGRARTRRQRKEDSPLLLLAAPLVVLFHVALVSTPGTCASQDWIPPLQC